MAGRWCVCTCRPRGVPAPTARSRRRSRLPPRSDRCLAALPLSVVAESLKKKAAPLDSVRLPGPRPTFDGLGALLLASSVSALIVPLTLLRVGVLTLPQLPPAYAAVSLVIVAFVWWELRHPDPLVQVRLFVDRTYRSACVSETLANISLFPFAVVVSIFLQSVQSR